MPCRALVLTVIFVLSKYFISGKFRIKSLYTTVILVTFLSKPPFEIKLGGLSVLAKSGIRYFCVKPGFHMVVSVVSVVSVVRKKFIGQI